MESAQLDQLRDKREQLQVEQECALLEAQISVFEQDKRLSQLLEVGQVWGHASDYIYDHPGFGPFHGFTSPSDSVYGTFHVDRVEDRQEGRYRPVYEHEIDLDRQRGIWRVLASVDEHGIGAVETLANYTLGTGYTYEASPKDSANPLAVSLAALCQEIIDEFTERDTLHWRRKEREFHHRSRRDGETFLFIEPIGGGRSDCQFIEPVEITEPDKAHEISEIAGAVALDWSMGIGTDIGNTNRVHGYYRDPTRDGRAAQFIPPERMVHAKRNVDETAKRGVSDFYPIWRNMERAAKVLRNTGEGASLQAAIAWIREHVPGTSLSAVQSMNAGKTVAEVDQRWPTGNRTTTKFRRYQPGTVLDVPNGQQYKPGPMGAERNEGFVSVADAIWRSTGVRWTMPSYMITGDPSSGAFASTLLAESPFVKARESDQVWYKEEFIQLMWKVVAIAVNTSVAFAQLGIRSVAEVKRLVNLNADPPRVSVRNRIEDTQIATILNAHGLLSRRTWAGQEDLDFDHERSQIAEEGPSPASALSPSLLAFPGSAPGRTRTLDAAGPSLTGEEPRPVGRVLGQNPQARDTLPNVETVHLPELPNLWEGYP